MLLVKDICCNPRLHDLVLAGWPPCCTTLSSLGSRVWIHAASHFYREKRVAWFSISMHACDPVAMVMGLRWGPSGCRSSAIKPSNVPWCCKVLHALFNNMRILKVKAQPTNSFFTTVNQMFDGSSQFLTIAEGAVLKSLAQFRQRKCSAVVGSWEGLPNI